MSNGVCRTPLSRVPDRTHWAWNGGDFPPMIPSGNAMWRSCIDSRRNAVLNKSEKYALRPFTFIQFYAMC